LASPSLAPQEHPDLVAAPTTKPQAALADSILFYGTFSLLFFGPLAFGSADAWAIFLLAIGAVSLFALWASRQVLSGTVRIVPHPLFRPIRLFGLLVIAQIAIGVSAYRYQTVSSALLYAVYACLMFLVVQLLQRTSQVKILAWSFCGYGACVALFAVLQSLSSNGKVYWLLEPHSGGWIYGPYVNHNHYAGLMEMLFPIPLVMALTQHVPRRWRAVPLFAAMLMVATIFLSGSRGGMIAVLVQAVILGIFLGLKKNTRTAWMAGCTLLVVALLMFWIGGSGAVERFTSIHNEAKTELAGGIRLAIDRDALKMFRDKPVLGWGLGNFPVVYPQFRSFYSEKFVNEAHNDYLQLLVEMGSLGFLTALWFLALTVRSALKKLVDWSWDFNGSVALAALLGCTGLLVHSFLDFNLQIPANAALFYVLCAIAAADTRFGAHRRLRHRHTASHAPEPATTT
jgi:O-antigen ligase